MKAKKLAAMAETIEWPKSSNDLPVLTWDQFQEEAKTRELVVISGFIHDVSQFIDEHPGGRHFIKTRLGKDATTAFYGGVYDHSNGAGNLLAQLRVGVIEGGYEVESLKKYSEVIENLKDSGAYGCAGKTSDISSTVRRTVVIKGDPAHKGEHLNTLAHPPTTNEKHVIGGLSQSFFE
jgi:stearoyl-CoA desaturase (delta-9 desaturase)